MQTGDTRHHLQFLRILRRLCGETTEYRHLHKPETAERDLCHQYRLSGFFSGKQTQCRRAYHLADPIRRLTGSAPVRCLSAPDGNGRTCSAVPHFTFRRDAILHLRKGCPGGKCHIGPARILFLSTAGTYSGIPDPESLSAPGRGYTTGTHILYRMEYRRTSFPQGAVLAGGRLGTFPQCKRDHAEDPQI